jgi:hypothetical protein
VKPSKKLDFRQANRLARSRLVTKNPVKRTLLFIVAVLASATVSAHAANLVTNPGFETGTFSGWMFDPTFMAIDMSIPHSGTYDALLASGGADLQLQQTITTVPGQLYNVSFWLDNAGGTPNDFSASFAGVTFFSTTNASAFPYTLETGTVTATGTSSLLSFSMRQDPAFWNLDDVSVIAVPEPSTWAILATGSIALLLFRRRNKAILPQR